MRAAITVRAVPSTTRHPRHNASRVPRSLVQPRPPPLRQPIWRIWTTIYRSKLYLDVPSAFLLIQNPFSLWGSGFFFTHIFFYFVGMLKSDRMSVVMGKRV